MLVSITVLLSHERGPHRVVFLPDGGVWVDLFKNNDWHRVEPAWAEPFVDAARRSMLSGGAE